MAAHHYQSTTQTFGTRPEPTESTMIASHVTVGTKVDNAGHRGEVVNASRTATGVAITFRWHDGHELTHRLPVWFPLPFRVVAQ